MKWEQALKDFRNYLKLERGLADNSIKNYVWDIEKLVKFLDINKLKDLPLDISKDTVERFVYEIAKVVNPRSQARIISGLKSFFSYLVFNGTEQC